MEAVVAGIFATAAVVNAPAMVAGISAAVEVAVAAIFADDAAVKVAAAGADAAVVADEL